MRSQSSGTNQSRCPRSIAACSSFLTAIGYPIGRHHPCERILSLLTALDHQMVIWQNPHARSNRPDIAPMNRVAIVEFGRTGRCPRQIDANSFLPRSLVAEGHSLCTAYPRALAIIHRKPSPNEHPSHRHCTLRQFASNVEQCS